MVKGKRVLIIVQNLPVPSDRRVWRECQALIGAGYQVSVVCPNGPGEASTEVLEGVRLRRYPPPPPTEGVASFLYEFVICWLRTARRVMQAARQEGFDVIQTCNPPDTYFALAWPFRLVHKQFVFDQHDLCPELYRSRFPRPNRALLSVLYLLERLTYLAADHVISTNESYRQVAISRGRQRQEHVTVVRNGPDGGMHRGQPDSQLKRGRKYLCCYVGVMGPQDGVDVAIRAADWYVHNLGRTDCHFALVGNGDVYERMLALIQELDLMDFVTMPGWVPDTLLYSYLSTADLGLSPDPPSPLNNVSTMNKTMDYMAFGLPVVAFDLPETRVSANAAAFYAAGSDIPAFAKAIADLLDDAERRDEMGRFGRQRVTDCLAWRHQVPSYLAVYERLARRGI